MVMMHPPLPAKSRDTRVGHLRAQHVWTLIVMRRQTREGEMVKMHPPQLAKYRQAVINTHTETRVGNLRAQRVIFLVIVMRRQTREGTGSASMTVQIIILIMMEASMRIRMLRYPLFWSCLGFCLSFFCACTFSDVEALAQTIDAARAARRKRRKRERERERH